VALRLWYRHCWQAPSLWPDAFKWPLPPHARIFFVSEISSENSFYCNNRPAKPYSQLFYNKATSHINNTQTQPVAAPGPNGCFLHFPQTPLSRALQRWAPQLGVCHWALWGAQRTGEARPGQARPGRGHAASMAALARGALGICAKGTRHLQAHRHYSVHILIIQTLSASPNL